MISHENIQLSGRHAIQGVLLASLVGIFSPTLFAQVAPPPTSISPVRPIQSPTAQFPAGARQYRPPGFSVDPRWQNQQNNYGGGSKWPQYGAAEQYRWPFRSHIPKSKSSDEVPRTSSFGILEQSALAELARWKTDEVRANSNQEALTEIANASDRLGRLYLEYGRFDDAKARFEEAMAGYSSDAADSDQYARSANSLARVHLELGQFVKARNLLDKNVERFEENEPAGIENEPQKQRDLLGDTLALLAEFCRETGDFQRAEKLHQRLIERRRQTYGEQHREYAVALHNQGIFEWRRNNYQRAERILRRELEITRSLNAGGRELAHSRESLALVLTSLGKFAEAESLFQAALRTLESIAGVERDRFRTLNNLGFLYIFTGQHADADDALSKSLSGRKELLGDDHLDHADTLTDLARLRLVQADYRDAIALSINALTITRKNIELTATVQSERQQLAMAALFRERLDLLLTAAAEYPDAATDAFGEVLKWKGATLVRQRRMREISQRDSVADQYLKLQNLTMRIASFSRMVPKQSADITKWKTSLQSLVTEKESMESQLSLASSEFRSLHEPPTLRQLVGALPSDGVLIDFFQYDATAPDARVGRFNSSPSLMASVVNPNGAVTAFYFGSSAEISRDVDRWRETFGVSPESKAAGKRLRQTLWEPLLTQIGAAKTILVSTDGPLGRLPLIALPGHEEGTYLIEDHRLVMIPVPQLIPAIWRKIVAPQLAKHLLLMGDVDYESTANSTQPIGSATFPWQRRRAATGDGARTFSKLEHTSGEIAAIERLYRNQPWAATDGFAMLDRSRATEARFRELAPQCYQLHLATHGFFASPDVASENAVDTRERRFADRDMLVRGVSPGLLSGLAFSGANLPPQPNLDDGILTADEIAALPLNGVELVVLSACETGLGEVAGGEGLIGIQRAFQISGARTTVASLWKIPDLATRLLMERFYRNYWEKKMTRLDALRDAQLWILNHPDSIRGVIREVNQKEIVRSPPEYWGAFVLAGDWR